MDRNRDSLKPIRLYKTAVLTVMVVLAVIMFLVLYLNAGVRNHLFSDAALLVPAAVAWIVLITCFATTLFDFIRLKDLAQTERNLSQMAYLDRLTGIPNRSSLDLMLMEYDGTEKMKHIGGVLFRIDNIAEINSTKGREAGDACILAFCRMLSDAVSEDTGFFGRNGGNEFVVMFGMCGKEELGRFTDTIAGKVSEYNRGHGDISLEIGYVTLLNEEAGVERFYAFITGLYEKYRTEARTLQAG